MQPNEIRMLAEKYECDCEAYDRLVCSFKNENGTAMPANGRELGLIGRHARGVMDSILRGNPDVTESEIKEALSELTRKQSELLSGAYS